MEKVLYEYGFNLENLLLCLIPLAVGIFFSKFHCASSQ